jgi:hypothetical protein
MALHESEAGRATRFLLLCGVWGGPFYLAVGLGFRPACGTALTSSGTV